MKTLTKWISELRDAFMSLRGIAEKIDLEINLIAHLADNPDAPVKWPGAYIEEAPGGVALFGLSIGGAKEPWHTDWLLQVEAEAHEPLIAALRKMYRDQLDTINRMLKTELFLSTLEPVSVEKNTLGDVERRTVEEVRRSRTKDRTIPGRPSVSVNAELPIPPTREFDLDYPHAMSAANSDLPNTPPPPLDPRDITYNKR